MEAGPRAAPLWRNRSMRPRLLSEFPKEEHAFSPHLTLARRGGSGSPRWRKGDRPNPAFQRLQEKLAALPAPEFGTMTAREFFLYQSQLVPGGARYTKIARWLVCARCSAGDRCDWHGNQTAMIRSARSVPPRQLPPGIHSLRLYPGAHFSRPGCAPNRQRQHRRDQCLPHIAGPGCPHPGS